MTSTIDKVSQKMIQKYEHECENPWTGCSACVEEWKEPAKMFEIVGPDGKVHYRRPYGHKDLDLNELATGYSIRLMVTR